MGRLSGKVVLITGGGSGLGRAAAMLAAQEDATVVVTDVNAAGGAETCRLAGQRCHFLQHDTRDEADWRRILGDIETRFGALHGLVNNAGILGPFPAPPESEDLERLHKIFAVNVDGVFLGCKLALPLMAKSGGGSIINLSSVAALIGTPYLVAYGMSKGAVRQLTKSIAVHAARTGTRVRCNSIHPGVIETPMGDVLIGDASFSKARQQAIPLGEFGRPEDVGHAIVYLLADESRYITGIELVIDGGLTAI